MLAANTSLSPPANMSISAYRVLYILLMLVRYRSLTLDELNQHLLHNPRIERIYNNDTVSKYINTLREVGCRIPRASNRNDYSYELQQTPFPLVLETDEADIAGKLLEQLLQHPDEGLSKSYRDFLDHLSWAIHLKEWSTNNGQEPLLFPKLAQYRKLLKTYQRYCDDAFHLHVLYQEDTGKGPHELYLEPQEVLQQGNHLLLVAVDCNSHQPVSLDVNRILEAKQLPSKNRRPPVSISVTFALYGRLAKSYRLYADERVISHTENTLVIKAKVNTPEELLNRLMKYGSACEILSPQKLRDRAKERITHMLASLSPNE